MKAAITLMKLPKQIWDDNAIQMSDSLPTSYMAAAMAESATEIMAEIKSSNMPSAVEA